MRKVNEIAFFALGFFVSINQGVTLVLGHLNDGTPRGADVFMPVDFFIYYLLFVKKDRSPVTRYRTLALIVKILVIIFLLWTLSGEFVSYERAEFRFELVHLIRALLLFYVFATRLDKKSEIVSLVNGLIYGLGFQSLIGFWQWRVGPVTLPFFKIENGWRASGTMGPANAFGVYLVSIIPYVIRYTFFTQLKPKLVYIIISLLSLASLFASYVRGAWFTFVGAMLIFFLIDLKKSKLKTRQKQIFIIVTILFSIGLGVKYGDKIKARMSGSKESLVGESKHSRKGLALDAIRIIKEHPTFGVGLNNYRYFADKDIGGTRIVHDLYLLIAAQQGIFALIIFLIIHAAIFIAGLRLLKVPDPLLYHIGAATLTSFLAISIYHLIAPDYRLPGVIIQHWRVVGMTLGLLIANDYLARQARKKKAVKVKTVLRSRPGYANL